MPNSVNSFPPRRPLSLPIRKDDEPRQGRPKVSWTHQNKLMRLKGQEVALVFPDDTMVIGKLLEADAFTVELEISDANGNKSEMTYFKSGLLGFKKAA